MRAASLSRCRYFITFIDDFSNRSWIYLCKEKSEDLQRFKVFKAEAEKQSDRKIKCLRSDSGGEYTSTEFKGFLREQGIVQELAAAYSPQQNGAAERLNRIILIT